MTEEQLKASYHNSHDLREMYTRENTERRRAGAHTLRRFLTTPQDKALTAKMVKIREEYQVANNDDVVIVYAKMLMAEGKEAELDPKLAEAAKQASIPRRTTPVY
jgi:ribosomal protein L18E